MSSNDAVILFFIVIIGGFAAFIIYQNAARKKEILNKVRREWGELPKREYTSEELESISHYFKNHQEGVNSIDDITWNDLDMDTIFMMMNYTYSSAGEEYLYHILRTPSLHQEELAERDRLIEYFMAHKKEREELQLLFAKTGKTRRISITDYIYSLMELEEKSNWMHILMVLGLLGSILFAILYPAAGVFALIFMISNNLRVYFRRKGEIGPYITSIAYIIKMIKSARMMEKIKIDEISTYLEKIKTSKSGFRKFMKNSVFVSSEGSMSGSLEEVVLSYYNMLFHGDLIKFNSMIKELKLHIDDLEQILKCFGLLESTIAIASFRTLLPFYCKPELAAGRKAYLKGENIYHPLIAEPVANSIAVEKGALITGSNASGKSTFLKTTAINSILAQTAYTCTCSKYTGVFFQIYTSMALRDDLMAKESYFIVEIKSLKRILNRTLEAVPVLCFVDEVLRGTNTVERISASAQILKSLAKENVVCFAATHDIELTYMLEKDYDNYHFQEEIKDNDVLFNYVLHQGRAVSRNAIKLLSVIGYDDSIIEKAEETAARFVKTGDWSL